jgi:hypothetical protein
MMFLSASSTNPVFAASTHSKNKELATGGFMTVLWHERICGEENGLSHLYSIR